MTARHHIRIAALGLASLLTFGLLASCAAVPDSFAGAISEQGLARLRQCESGGNYRAVSRSGAYRGAYQFSQGTWNATAGRHYPHLRGVDPANAHPWDQDRMARALWATGGPRNWPVCSKRV